MTRAGDIGRPIINIRGETLQALLSGRHVMLKISGLADALTELPRGAFCYEMALSRDEAIAASLKLADACGMIAELREKVTVPHG